ncbi:MAG: rRNA pseudouridine synthase [Lachnospiraceae bacterium]|nr:rRNA pseudouridine synthase [Lachnospiraceae bacterium]
MIRIDKYLSDMGCGTRTELKKMIRSGKVYMLTPDGEKCCKDPAAKIPEDTELVIRAERENAVCIRYEEFQYILLNKPQGVVSAVTDPIHETVTDICRGYGIRDDISPVGRLDLDTEGLILLTNDGALAHRLLAPDKHVEKEYEVRVRVPFTGNGEALVQHFAEGIDIPESDKGNDAFRSKSAKLVISGTEPDLAHVTITEGKYHQVKRMFAAVGNEVVHLKRIRMGSLTLPGDLKAGEYIKLSSPDADFKQEA